MFHKKALKNTVTCFVLLTLVFSTLIVAALAASASQSSTYLTATITANKALGGDSGSASGSYKSNSHTHTDGDCPSLTGSYMGAGLDGYGSDGKVYEEHTTSNKASSISVSDSYPFGWDLDYVIGEIGIECGECNNMYNICFRVTP